MSQFVTRSKIEEVDSSQKIACDELTVWFDRYPVTQDDDDDELQTGRMMDKSIANIDNNELNFPAVATTEADLKGMSSRNM